MDVDMIQDRLIFRIAEADILIVDHAVHFTQLFAVWRIHDIRLCLHDFIEPLEAGISFLQHLRKFDEHFDRRYEDIDIQRIGRQRHRLQCALGDEPGAAD